jgi:hypothetical protein
MVKRGATVTAVDIDTRFIEHLASDVVDVRRLDIRTDELPDGDPDDDGRDRPTRLTGHGG